MGLNKRMKEKEWLSIKAFRELGYLYRVERFAVAGGVARRILPKYCKTLDKAEAVFSREQGKGRSVALFGLDPDGKMRCIRPFTPEGV